MNRLTLQAAIDTERSVELDVARAAGVIRNAELKRRVLENVLAGKFVTPCMVALAGIGPIVAFGSYWCPVCEMISADSAERLITDHDCTWTQACVVVRELEAA